MNFLCADSKFLSIQAIIVEKIEHESDRQVSYDLPSEFSASFQNQLMGGVEVSVEQFQCLSKFCQAAPVAIQKFLAMKGCLRKCFGKN